MGDGEPGAREPGRPQRVLAYGSNMHLPDLRRWLRTHGHTVADPLSALPARLPDHALAWNYRSASRRGGAANVVPCPGAEVRGVVLEVDDALLAALDEKEGHPTRYDRGAAPVTAHLLADGRPTAAWLYRVTPAFTSSGTVPPRAAYLALVVRAAEEHGLGDDWVARLRAVPTDG